jgi:hypothetical protein
LRAYFHLSTDNDKKEVVKRPAIIRSASPGADLPEVLLPKILLGAIATMCGMVAIGGSAVVVDLFNVD